MKEPWFWSERTIAATVVAACLAPAAALYGAVQTTRRALARPAPDPVPVFCVGAASMGGAGKTPFALLLRRILSERFGFTSFFATRGYGGREGGPLQVDPERHDARDVGDEALLLAKSAPTFVARDRAAGVRAAVAGGAQAVVMDDGFQNPDQTATFSFLLMRAAELHARTFPAGRLRESIRSAALRADAIVEVGTRSVSPAVEALGKPALAAWLQADDVPPRCAFAFCGIGRPQQFFDMLRDCGSELAGAHAYDDHRFFRTNEVMRLKALADKANASLITTEKDLCRLPEEARAHVAAFKVSMRCDEDALASLLGDALSKHRRRHA